MKTPLDGLNVPNTTSATLGIDSNRMREKSVSRIKENAVIFPRRLKGCDGCRYERIEDMEGGGDVVYVPLGAVQVRSELGWRAMYDTHEGKLFFIRMNDATERSWSLPAVSDEVLRQYGVIGNESTRSRSGNSNEDVEKEREGQEEVRGSSINKIEEEEDENVGTGINYEEILQEKDEQKSHEHNSGPRSCSSGTINGIATDDNERGSSVATQSPLPSSKKYDTTMIDSTRWEKSKSMVSFGTDPVPTEPRSLLALMNTEVCSAAPRTSRSVDPQTFPIRQSSSKIGESTHNHIDLNSFFPKNNMVETEPDVKVVRILQEENNARHCFEEEEFDARNVLLDEVQKMLDELLFPEENTEEVSEHTIVPSKVENLPFVSNGVTDDNEFFLRNLRLSEIGDDNDDDAVTPLEKLLRDYSLGDVREDKVPIPVAFSFANIYQPPSAMKGETISPLRLDEKPTVHEQIHTPHNIYSQGSKIELSPARLLEAQRHQVEMERRLTQRDRDNLERALDKRYQEIDIPSDTHLQLRYEPSSHFTRECQAILDARGIIPEFNSSQGETSSPQKLQQYQQGQRTAKLQSADVSPISPKTFIRSPTPAKRSEMNQIGRETIVTEAYETKYKVGLAAMQSLMELYQTFMITKHVSYPCKKEVSSNKTKELSVDEAIESSVEKYVDRLTRIQELYTCTKENIKGPQYCENGNTCRPVRTPALPSPLNYQDTIEGTLPYSMGAAIKEQKTIFSIDVSDGKINCIKDGVHGENVAQISSNSFAAWQNRTLNVDQKRGIKTPKFITSEVKTNHRILEKVFTPHYLPHRLITTPPVIVPVNVPRPNDAVNISRPVLRWDAKRSGNIIISHTGTKCMADASRTLKLIASETDRTGVAIPSVLIPMYALGTIGISEGEFIFEVRVDAHSPSIHTPESGIFAVGVTTKYYRGSHKTNPAYLFRSDGTIVATSEDERGVPYGCPYHSGSHITVYLDLVHQQLSFFLNGRPLGVAFKFKSVNDPEPLFPVVVFSGEGDTASFVPPSAPQIPRHLKPPLVVESQLMDAQ
ncbi:SPRY domain [Trypanosoma melophagium]|uniref:SPRY domain n=1 Tax=Trypanosoma melophagium TaxID=715481 RepID=UPI00351A4C86|nr:SPRY domain [Trypanosoma melophagium]